MRLKSVFLILATVASSFLGGCGLVNEPGDTSCLEPSDTVHLRFKVSTAVNTTGYDLTRSDDMDHTEEDSLLPQIEDMINVRDFAFFIFVGDGDDAPLICASTNIFESTDPNMNITGSMGFYNVSVFIRKDLIKKYLDKDELDPNSGTLIKLKLVVIANSNARRNATGGNWTSLPQIILGGDDSATTFGEFMTEAQKLTYEMTSDFYDPDASSISYKVVGMIPMFGIKQFQVTEAQAYKSRPEERIYLGEINLLRAMSKIRIIDNIPKSESGYPAITGASFTYASSTGGILPINAKSYVDGTQVHTANIPQQTDLNSTTVSFLNNPAGYQVIGTDGSIRTLPEWLIYSPEQRIVQGDVPVMKIFVKPYANADDTYFDVPMSGYKNVTFPWPGSPGYLLRNHVYTLQVDDASIPLGLTLNWTVCPMDEVDIDIPPFN